METMTDTPETDDATLRAIDIEGCGEFDAVHVQVAKRLERERDRYREQADALVDRLGVTQERMIDAERERDEHRAQLREEQQLHVQTLNERDEARQWESQAIVARIQRDEFSKTLGEVREILCAALPNENQLTSFMAVKLARERDEWKAKYIQQNKDLGCEQMDPNGTIWDHAKKLEAELDEARAAIPEFTTP